MNYDIYKDIDARLDLGVFEFVSMGKNGEIRKRVKFVPTALPNVYNLAFGDIDEFDEIDDQSKSDNGDRNIVLATIVKIVDLYSRKYPERLIYFRGSTVERTRLYRMAVGINLEELSKEFEIYGEVDDSDDLVPFCKNMKISAFVIKRKLL